MHQMLCKKTLLFVEGTMEKIFVNTNFPHIEVIGLPNGEGWTPAKLGAQIQSLYKTKDFNADVVIVWFDREKTRKVVTKFEQ